MRPTREQQAERILAVVLDVLATDGYDAVQVRTIAAGARVSLGTVYKIFGTRDGLVNAAMLQWMQANAYADIRMPDPDESAFGTLVRIVRSVFEPWEKNPKMLEAFFRARTAPGGEGLELQGLEIAVPVADAALRELDPEFRADLRMIVFHVLHSSIGDFAAGKIPATDIVPILERTLYRLLPDAARRSDRPRSWTRTRRRSTKP